eukprot:TRINITY_DN5302_c0_g1_i2.p1 TRINITY_DN5302_c0_g1~~TRINITY_DN5302_c0_g1_i2.p1  ORF type:complete len:101 (+),score=11.93 TRINITY_DN5302_c0_g1_i2:275-577(+)
MTEKPSRFNPLNLFISFDKYFFFQKTLIDSCNNTFRGNNITKERIACIRLGSFCGEHIDRGAASFNTTFILSPFALVDSLPSCFIFVNNHDLCHDCLTEF